MPPPTPPMPMRLLTLPVLLALGACHLVPDSQAPVVPQRPTFSSNTNTAARGTLEVETGATLDPGDSFSLPTTLRYGAGPATEVFLGGSPLLYVAQPGEDEVGLGDTTVGLRHRIREEDDQPALAIQAAVKVPTANSTEGLGTGETDASFAAIASKAVDPFSFTLQGQIDVLGDPTGGADLGIDLAFAGGYPMAPGLGLFGELAGLFVPDADSEQVFCTLGLAATLAPFLVVDTALVVGLTPDAPDFQLLIGLTRNFGVLSTR